MFMVLSQPQDSIFLQSPGHEKLTSCALVNSNIVGSGFNFIVSIKTQYVARRACLWKKKKDKFSTVILKILLFYNNMSFS